LKDSDDTDDAYPVSVDLLYLIILAPIASTVTILLDASCCYIRPIQPTMCVVHDRQCALQKQFKHFRGMGLADLYWPMNHAADGCTYKRHLVNTTERPVLGGDAGSRHHFRSTSLIANIINCTLYLMGVYMLGWRPPPA